MKPLWELLKELTNNKMADVASKDDNSVSSLLGASSTDGTPVKIYASPTSHRLLVDGVGATGPTGAKGATGPTGPIGIADGVYTPIVSITVAGGLITAIATA